MDTKLCNIAGISPRLRNALRRIETEKGVSTISELSQIPLIDIWRIRGVGRRTINELKELLARYKLITGNTEVETYPLTLENTILIALLNYIANGGTQQTAINCLDIVKIHLQNLN